MALLNKLWLKLAKSFWRRSWKCEKMAVIRKLLTLFCLWLLNYLQSQPTSWVFIFTGPTLEFTGRCMSSDHWVFMKTEHCCLSFIHVYVVKYCHQLYVLLYIWQYACFNFTRQINKCFWGSFEHRYRSGTLFVYIFNDTLISLLDILRWVLLSVNKLLCIKD